MGRATSIPATRRRHKKYLKAAKGFVGGRSKLYRQARETVKRAWVYATVHRRLKKRTFRALWITRLTAAARENGLTYSRLIDGLKKAQVGLDRKSLSVIAASDPKGFTSLVKLAQKN